MFTPAGITRKVCTSGLFSAIEGGDELGAIVTITSSAPNLVWSATGDSLFSYPAVITVEPGDSANISLIPTDLDGWMVNGSPVDVSNGMQSHTYKIDIQPFVYNTYNKRVNVGKSATYYRVVIPSSAPDVIDLDTLVSYSGASGVTISVPNTIISEAQDILAQAQDAVNEAKDISGIATPDDVVKVLIEDDSSETNAALSTAIGALAPGRKALAAPDFDGDAPADQITAAAASVPAGDHQVVIVPPSMRPAADPDPGTATDLSLNDRVTLLDTRMSYGLVTNVAQRAGWHLYQQFGGNTDPDHASMSDNGATFAAEAFLTGGEGGYTQDGSGNVTGAYGENVALYAGLRRKAGSTRSGWGLNVVATDYNGPTATSMIRGIELDFGNVSGTDATDSTVYDGLVLLAGGTNKSRNAFVIGRGSGSGQWLRGILMTHVDEAMRLVPSDDTVGTPLLRGRNAADTANAWWIGRAGDATFTNVTTRDLKASRGDGSGQVSFGNGAGYFFGNGSNIQFSQPLKAMASGCLIIGGTGSPEGVITAPPGSLFLRGDGGANTSVYFKESGTGNTGWVGK